MVVASVVAALAFLRRKVEWGTGWVWPVPGALTFDGKRYAAVVSDGVGSPRGEYGPHRGVDIMYRRKSREDRAEYPPGTVNGTPWHFAPPRTPILAAKDGVVWSAGPSPRGYSVVVDHGKPFATYYTHMESLAIAPHASGVDRRTRKVTAVKAGDVIGYMGRDPMGPRIRHLHFSVAHGGAGEKSAVDPGDVMPKWKRVDWDFLPDPKVKS